MKISVIIPALDEADRIAASVERAALAGGDEILVVDGGSSDDTASRASALPCRVVESPRGRAVQQNAGARHATGDVLLFLHADNWLAAGAIDQIRAALADSRIVWGAFRQRIEARGVLYRLIEAGNAFRAAWLRRPYGDQAIFVRRAAFDAIGGFDTVPILEDVLLAKKLVRIAPPALLAGPLHVSARRWQRHGVARQTLRNWSILARAKCGVPLERLAAEYSSQST